MLGRAPRDACSWTAAPHYNENINTLELPRVSQPVPFFRVVRRGIPSSSIPAPGFRAGQIGITVASVRGHRRTLAVRPLGEPRGWTARLAAVMRQ